MAIYSFPASDRVARILRLSMPIVGGMVSQNVFNLIDTAMVGSFGNDALAAVGFGGFLNFLLISVVLGLSAGVQTMAARRKGEGRTSELAVPLNGGILLALSIAIPWSILLIAMVPTFFPWLIDDPHVVALGVPYLQHRLIGMAPMACNFCFRGHWNGTDRSRLYMLTLLLMHGTNIFLNWVLIFGNLGAPELGTEGAGIASAISAFVGMFLYVGIGLSQLRREGFLRGIPDGATLRMMISLSLPNSLQQVFFAGGLTVLFWIVGLIGTAEAAATQVIVNLMLVSLLPGLGFGLAAAALAGQSLGQRKADEARQWGWDVAKVAIPVIVVLALPAILVPHALLYIFLHAEPETLALSVWPLRIVAITLPLDTLGLVLMNALIGAGDTRRAAGVSIVLQWAIYLPLAYVLGVELELGLSAVWLVNLAYRWIQAGIFVAMWRGNRWASIRV